MPKFSRLFWWLIVGGVTLAAVAVAVANNVADSRFASYIGIVAVLVNLCGFVLVSEQLRATSHATESVWNAYMKKIYGTSPALSAFLNRECERYTRS